MQIDLSVKILKVCCVKQESKCFGDDYLVPELVKCRKQKSYLVTVNAIDVSSGYCVFPTKHFKF